MAKYIDADLLRSSLEDKIEEAWMDHDYYRGYNDGLETAINALEEAPAADVKSAKHGKWINTHSEFDPHMRKCTACEKQLSVLGGPLDYCPNCGAKMKGVTK